MFILFLLQYRGLETRQCGNKSWFSKVSLRFPADWPILYESLDVFFL
jgi:hypothetical protein